MLQKRPGSVLTIAILHLIGGGLGLLIGICAGLGLLVQGTFMKSLASADPQNVGLRLQAYMAQRLPFTNAVGYGEVVINLVLSVMLLTAGIGLLSMRNWARILSLVYAVMSILHKLFAFGFFVFVSWPVVSEFLEAEARTAPAQGSVATQLVIAKASAIGGAIFNAIFIVYPIVVLFVLLKRSVRLAFTEQPSRDRADEDDHDDRPRRPASRRDDEDYDDDDRWR
jgi:hypothetical protein